MSRCLRLAALAALAAACAHPPPPLHASRLVVQSSRSGVRVYLPATVDGEPTLLVLDTGAARSMLPASFVHAHRLGRRSGASDEHMVDANGNLTRMPFVPSVPVQFEGEATAGTIDFLMNPTGFGDATVTPGDLVRAGWALVIDVGRRELTYEPEGAAVQRLRAAGSPLREEDFRNCRDTGGQRAVSATINGVSARMMIDTGATGSVLARNNPALPSMIAALGDRGSSRGIGSMGKGLVVDAVPIAFSGTSFVAPVMVLPESQPCGEGLLGADLLRHCTIVWGASALWMACRAPEAPRGRLP